MSTVKVPVDSLSGQQQEVLFVEGITLLSVEEFEVAEDKIPQVHETWWLRSPGAYGNSTAILYGNGYVFDHGFRVYNTYGVRPALRVSNLESTGLQIGDRFKLADETWTVISERHALCDSIVGETPFRDDWKASDANDYEKSDVKVWLEKWAKERGITCQ